MYSRFSAKYRTSVILATIFILWPRVASGIVVVPEDRLGGGDQARANLVKGFEAIQEFFAEREFSLLVAWKEMRVSEDPLYFEHAYPEISIAIDQWASGFDRGMLAEVPLPDPVDYTFLLERFSPRVLDAGEDSTVRDNALASVCMICVMDDLRCDRQSLHTFLQEVVTHDPSPLRKTEALQWWRRTRGEIDVDLMEQLLSSPAGSDPDLRAEIAKVLISLETRRSARALEFLVRK